MLKMPAKKQTWEFYTETKEGVETLIATKVLKHPAKCKTYLDMQNKGFVDGIHTIGFRLVDKQIW